MSSEEEYNENEELDNDVELEEEEKPRRTSRILLILFVVILIGLNLFFVNNIMTQKKVLEAKEAEIVELNETKKNLEEEISKLKQEIDEYVGKVDEKDNMLKEYLSQIDELQLQLNKAKKSNVDVEHYKREANRLKSIEIQFNQQKATIDSLKKAYSAQREIAASLKNQVDTLNKKTNQLSSLNDDLSNKVDLASKLKVSNISIESFREKNGKEKATDKANQANRIKICYTINDNTIASKGKKDVYLCLKGSKVTDEASNTFEVKGGKTLTYTIKDVITYNGQATSNCPYYIVKEGNELAPGSYKVEIYLDGNKVGEQSITLR